MNKLLILYLTFTLSYFLVMGRHIYMGNRLGVNKELHRGD